MEIIKVTYERIFPLAPYVNEKVGFEATIDGSIESEKEALTKLKQVAEEWHKANNKELYQLNGQVILDNSIPPGPPPVIQVQQQDIRIGVLVEDIMSCKELAVLDSYRLMVKGNDELSAAYNKRRSEIVGAEIDDIVKRTDELTIKTRIDKKHYGKAL